MYRNQHGAINMSSMFRFSCLDLAKQSSERKKTGVSTHFHGD